MDSTISFFNHLYKYRESWILPIHFIGSVAYGFRDVLKEMCESYELQLGKVLKNPHGWIGKISFIILF
ncbi:MAG: hypothetical protein WDM71_09770 [Ferruginibacter sp.]